MLANYIYEILNNMWTIYGENLFDNAYEEKSYYVTKKNIPYLQDYSIAGKLYLRNIEQYVDLW